jgi:hypothetical protein
MKRSIYIFPLLFMLLLHFSAAAYQANYYNAIIVTEPHGINETNFPMLVTVNTQALIGAGQMMSTGADIRFSDSVCPVNPAFLDYYIESGLNTTTTKIWVRMPAFAASATDTIYMLYGDNTATAASNFSATFPNAMITGGNNLTVTGTENVGWLQVDANDTLFLTAGSAVTFNAEKVIIAATGAVIGDGAGYQPNPVNSPAGNGPGAGTKSPVGGGAGGGSYGGIGGGGGGDFGDIPGSGGAVYGTATGTDIDMGSSGGSSDVTTGGAGGGAVTFYSNDFAMHGLVSMNGVGGGGGQGRNGGGGAGGGVLVMTRNFDGTAGLFQANGGAGGSGSDPANDGGGGGAGGRIKFVYNSYISYLASYGGGPGGVYGDSAYGQPGASGSLYTASVAYTDPIVSAQGSSSPNVTIGADPGVIVCQGTPISFIASVTGAGINTPSFQWFLNGNPVGTNSGIYTLSTPATGNTVKCVVSTPGICTSVIDTSNTLTVIVNPPSPHLAGTIGNSESQSLFVSGPVDARYASDCDLIASLTPSGFNPVSGNTNFKVTIDNIVNTYNGQPFATRHFDIEPSTTASTATAVMTLYAYQYEFDDYNFVAGTLDLPPLPSGGVDNGNVRITQFHGTGTAPGNYTGTEELIVPGVSWDATNNWWVMTFSVTGFSGFYIHTTAGSHPLAVNVSDIRAANVDKRNRVDWKTATEETGDVFILQRSRDGKDFADIASLQAKGSSSTYTYWDEQPFAGVNYYRIGLKARDGTLSYTSVVTATVGSENTLVMTAYPNPVKDIVTVKLSGERAANGTLTLTDLVGRTVRKLVFDAGNMNIDMSNLPAGNYFIKYTDDLHSEVLKVNKQ